MSLRLSHTIALPAGTKGAGFGAADQHHASGRLFVARPDNDAVDVVDTIFGVYLYSVPELRGVSALLVAQSLNELFTANTNENKIGFFQAADRSAEKMVVGRRPMGLAWDARRGVLWVANSGHPAHLGECSLSVVDFVTQTRVVASLALPGRPHTLCYAEQQDTLYVSLDDPARIALVAGPAPAALEQVWALPGANIRTMLADTQPARLLCGCADGTLRVVEQGRSTASAMLPAAPGGMALQPELRRLYIASGERGTLQSLDADTLQPVESIQTEAGAATLFLDLSSSLLYLFCPLSSRALVYRLS